MVLVDIVPCILRTLNIQSAMYFSASGINADLVRFCDLALRVSAAWEILSPHLLLRSSDVVLEYLLLGIHVCGILTSCIVSTCSLVKDTCFFIFHFDMVSNNIRAAIMSALYLMSLLLIDGNI